MLCANLCPTGALIQEEAFLMKEKMIEINTELSEFHASNGWLDSFKTTYGIRETVTVISGKPGNDGKTSTTCKRLYI